MQAFGLSSPSIHGTTASRIAKMVELHYQYCPTTLRCSGPESSTPDPNGTFVKLPPPMEQRGSCCHDCSCSEDCSDHGTCCPDSLTTLPSTIDITPVPLCQRPQLLQYGSRINTYGHNMVITCSPNYTGVDVRKRCRNSDVNLQSYTTVTDRKTGQIYKNRYCAECNFVNGEDLVNWQANLKCFRYQLLPRNEQMLLEGITKNDRCNVIFNPPPGYSYARCTGPYIGQCNVTGKWKKHDKLLEDSCHAYTSIYNGTYRNVFCYMCNEVGDPAVDCGTITRRPVLVSFSALLDFAEDDDHPETPLTTSCKNDQFYDAYKGRCEDITCSRTRYLVNGTCRELFQSVLGYCYNIMLKVTPSNATLFENITWTGGALKNYMEAYIDSIGLTLFLGELDIYHYESSGRSQVPYFLVYFMVSIYQESSLDFVPDLFLLDRSLQTLQHDEQSKQVWFQLVAFQAFDDMLWQDPMDGTNLTLYYTLIQVPCPPSGVIIVLTKLIPCPRVQLRKNEYEIQENITGLHVRDMDLFFRRDEYEAAENNDAFYVCLDDYIDRANDLGKMGTINVLSNEPTAAYYLSVVSAVVSIFCLLVSLSVYAMFPVLRTQPGKNNMVLAVSLLCAQSMFQFAVGYKKSILYWGCQVIGVLVHFLWLNVLFCMNACCIHMFLAFSSTSRYSPINGGRYTLKYILYGLFASSVPVMINIVVAVVQSEGEEIGYAEGVLCFISSPFMLGMTFALPLGLVILTNFSLFIIVVVQVSRLPTVEKDVKNRRNYFKIYAKLSTLTGITWIFGFIFVFTGVDVIEYLFIVLNGGQGFFIMIAFVCNKRVLELFRRKITDIRPAMSITFNELHATAVTNNTTVSETSCTTEL